jgi:hypothetical protein
MDNLNSSLPTQDKDVADIVLQEMKRIRFLRFHNSVFDIGPDEVPLGTEFYSYPLDGRWGWVLFEDKELIDQKMQSFGDGKPRKPNDGRDWQFQYQIPFKTMDGEMIAFVTSTVGGRMGVEELCKTAAENKKAGLDYEPKIKLAIETFPSTKHGEQEKPKFEIVDAPVEISKVKKTPIEVKWPDEVKKKANGDLNDEIPIF